MIGSLLYWAALLVSGVAALWAVIDHFLEQRDRRRETPPQHRAETMGQRTKRIKP